MERLAALPGASVFVGRRREQAELKAAVERARAGRGALIVLSGEPGIGKTCLAEQAAAAARGHAAVLWGICREESGAPAFWPWVQILDACSRLLPLPREQLAVAIGEGFPQLADLVPALRARTAESDRLRLASEDVRFYLFDAAMRLLRQAALAQPLVIVFDDAHAADIPSLLLLQFVAAELVGAPILLIVTHRDTPSDVDTPHASLLAGIGRRGVRMRLGGFGEEEVGEYLRRVFEVEAAPELVRTLHRKTDGNPYFVDELARLLAAEGRLADSDAATSADLRVPAGVGALLRQRLLPLGADARRLLDVAAVVGREFDFGLAEAASGLSRTRVLDALGEARAADLIHEVALGRYVFAHGLVRDTLYDDLPEARRLALHGGVAAALERLHAANLDPHLDELAHHYGRAALGGDVHRAVEYALRAGRRAAALSAYEVAAAHFERGLRALELAPDPPERARCEMLLLLGDSAFRAGDLDRGRAACLEAGDLAHRLRWAEAEARAALSLGGPWVEIGSVDGTLVRALERALEALAEADGIWRARVLARLARELYWSDQPERAAASADESLAMARRLDDSGALAEALASRAYALWRPDRLAERIAVEGEIARLAEEAGDLEMALRGHLWLASDLLEAGDAEGLERQCGVYERLAARVKQPTYLWYVPRNRAMRALLRGEFDDAERLAAEAYTIGVNAHRGLAAQAQAILTAVLRWERGELAGLAKALETFRQRYPAVAAWACGQAFLYAEDGDADEARRAVARIGTDLPRDANWLLSISLLALACAAIADESRCAEIYDALLPYRGRNVTMGRALICFGSTSHFLGALATVLRRWDEAEAHFDEAVRIHERFGARPWIARTRARWARLLIARGEAGDRQRARTMLDEAIAVAQELGMQRLLERARERRLRLDGETTEPSARSPTPAAESPGATATAVCRRDGDYWTVGTTGTIFRLKDSKGIRYLAQLLRQPNQAFHAMELERDAAPAGEAAGSVPIGRGLRPSLPADAGEILDARARAEYRERLRDLRSEADEATAMNDGERARHLREEIDALTDQLEQALGLGGRPRSMGSPQERARINVTKQIKVAIRRIAEQCPPLGDALARDVRTGRFCSYVPDPRAPIDWGF